MARKLSDKRKNRLDDEVGYSKNVVNTDVLDKRFFREVKDNNPKISETLETAQNDYEQFEELQEDIFASLFRYKPRLLRQHQVKTSHLLNREVMEQVMESPKYKELRALTRLDKINSTVGTEVLGDEAHELVKKLKEQQESLQELQDAENAAGGQGQPGQGQGQGAQPGNATGGEPGEAPNQHTLEEAKKLVEEKRKEFHRSMKKKEVQQGVRQMLNQVHKNVVETSDMIQQWGLDGDDTFQRMGYHEKMELLKRLRDSDKLKRIAKLAGRFKRIASQRQREKVKKGMDEIFDLTLGDELGRLIPSELMKLRHPVLKNLFFKDFVEKKLLQYNLRGKEKKAKGPIVVCIDDSGSMSGEPEIWAKAVAMALLEVAVYQKRSFYCIHFDHTQDPHKLHINEFLRNEPFNIQEVIDMAEYFSGGGTQFEPSLILAQEKINQQGEFQKADIVFITDGESAVRDDWVKEYCKWRDENKVAIYGILIDATYNSDATMKEFCTEIHKLSALNSDSSEDLAITLFDGM